MRLRISEKVVGLKLDKFGNLSNEPNWKKKRIRGIGWGKFGTNAFNLVTKKIGGMNWQVIVCRVCQGMIWMGCGGELNLKFSKVCEGWGMIQ